MGMVWKRFWKLSIFVWASLLGLFSPQVVVAADMYAFSSTGDQQRFLNLTKELRCLVCQNQSLADSDAVLAKDLRQKIYLMVQEKRSDEEIKQFLVTRYGDFILFSPPLVPATILLWGFPAFLLVGLFLGICYYSQKEPVS